MIWVQVLEEAKARCFISPEKQVFLIGFSLTFPRFARTSKNQLNTATAEGSSSSSSSSSSSGDGGGGGLYWGLASIMK